jgi:hypothetical protein
MFGRVHTGMLYTNNSDAMGIFYVIQNMAVQGKAEQSSQQVITL